MFRRFSLTTSMLLLTIVVGVVIWVGYDAYQFQALNSVLKENLTQRFNEQAREQRLRFDSYIKSFNPSVKLYAENAGLKDYLQQLDWRGPVQVIEYERIPPWLPALSSMRRFVLPRYAMLIDESGNVRELYHYKGSIPPAELLKISAQMRELSQEQGYLTLIEGRPYLVTSEKVNVKNIHASLFIASPVDERFLADSQGVSSHDVIIALLEEGDDKILVSNNEEIVPSGISLNSLKQTYLFVDEGFFGSGSSDIVVRFSSLISTQEVKKQTHEILNKDRRIRAITAITFIVAFGLVMYWITSRIQKLSQKVIEFSEKMNMPQPELRHKDELVELNSRFELLAQAVQHETQTLEYQTLHDLLTKLPNRKLLYERVTKEISACESSGGIFVLMMCDLNRFKYVNDTLGHHVGDVVLQQAGERLQSSLRKDDTVARLGGDEFAVLLSAKGIADAKIIATKLIDKFNAPFVVESNIINVGISIGIVEYPQHGNDVSGLMKCADSAMYHAKNKQTGFSVYDALITCDEKVS